MAERRQALLIACEEFVDPQYKRLVTPVRDARAFAKILGDPEIGQFSIDLLENASRDAIVDKLEGFFEEARPDDVLLLYLAGHGDLDERQKFYFVAHDTRSKRLLGKGVADHLIHEAMARSLSKRQILILDCCYSGAISKDWASGWISRGDASAGIKQKLTGEGRVVLTASDMLEYAYEKRSASGDVESLFTNRIIEGMERGDADIDGDGYISVDELYSYVEERIRCEDPSQKPQKSGRVHGQLWLAKAVPRPDALPRGVIDLINHAFPTVKLAGIEELQQRLSSNPALYQAAVQALTKLRSDGDSTVQLVASRLLERIEAQKREERERATEQREKERLENESRQTQVKERLEAERRQKEEQARLETQRHDTEAKERLDAECREREEKERFAAERRQREEKERLDTKQRQREEKERQDLERSASEHREKDRKVSEAAKAELIASGFKAAHSQVAIAEEVAGHSASPSDTIPPPNPTAHDPFSRETAHETKPQPATANNLLDTTTPATGELRSGVERQVLAPSDDSSTVDDLLSSNPGVGSPTWAMAPSQKRSATKSRILLFFAIFAIFAIGGLIFLIVRSNTGSRSSANVSAKPEVSQRPQSASSNVPARSPSPSPVSVATLTPAPVVVDRNAKVMVLTYHRFEDNPRDALAISPAEFKSQMQALKDNGVRVIPMMDLLAWRRSEKSIPLKSCVITIDDGYVSGYSVAWPILKEYGYPFTMFIYTNYVGTGGKSLTWHQLGEMRDAGVDIESHTLSHHDLRRAPPGQDYATWLHNEVYDSKAILEDKLGIKISVFAFPYGTHNEMVRKTAVEAGYQALFTVYGQHLSFDSPADQLGRYAIESLHPDVFKMALDFGPENDSSLGTVSMQLAAASMLTQPMNDEHITNLKPTIKANLTSMGDVEPGSVEMRVNGFGMVPAQYDAKTKLVSYAFTQKLVPRTYTVIIAAKAGGKRVETRWNFTVD
jgi:peptidoglycan/xylan/chitin deacetylase (PgdA/CDA1 family)